ncbi:MAG: membrane protein insertion efficiency factor YidD [Candidatus Portnoybacteria bacterium CG10_big_fil_rev_8_21_14_0_10_36_7]|uniref:Membrane protein insertion efficiency factor YidD n=1 Tax=Candidatus Portnoybacteria bacterium CG10_big_fil_rev_8_21_14_0_10_36_7 TaxID=1974812 RepID=A0A2M8KEE3_9BACT|nr:MAG: membrane protein insertion efficiency factor YidD [Candidatus Portnoybacteria bacterium CG10_big_fil_rev_8_21_14_0_10_36_7]
MIIKSNGALVLYKYFIGPLLFQLTGQVGACRFNPTCSEYFEQAVEKYGAKGFWLGIKRIISCHPLSKKEIYNPLN